jgi:hypothetical protein
MENAKLQQQKKNHLIKSYLFCMGMQDIPWGPKRYLRFVGRSWKAQNFEKTYFNESYGFCHGHGNSYLEVQKSVWGWPVGHIKHKITKKKKTILKNIMVLHGHAKTCLETSKNAWGWVVSCGKCKIIYKKESISKIAMVFAWAWNNIRWGSEMCLRVAIMSWKTQNYNKKLISTKVMVLAQACKIINWGLKYA